MALWVSGGSAGSLSGWATLDSRQPDGLGLLLPSYPRAQTRVAALLAIQGHAVLVGEAGTQQGQEETSLLETGTG